MKSHPFSKSDSNDLLKKISSQWEMELPKLKRLLKHEIDDHSAIITGESFTALKIDDLYLPFLTETTLLERFPRITVDAGAIKFVCNGANIMRPGITKFTEFQKDQVVCVVEETHNKFLAVGKSLVSSSEMQETAKGEIIKNLHYISDKYWELAKLIKK